ncbi:MAG: hypothetical protein KA766_14375 [Piscinibacter sp.]|uniref:tetratricopeptide repeat protein n=1 Tax=Piscinibacter sp. TaxID=1903157 RepID=UPI001B44B5C3|nr:hypothetical protein [Piscinibacter sp.]MBP5991186.1 hypothetical protein [Piscinibacter sp.]MBP6026491.1 hypothetical protein [Piscinibacter sp.]
MSVETAGRPSSSASRRHARRRRGTPAWQLALAGAALFSATAGTIYWLASRPAAQAPLAAMPPAPPAASAPASQAQAPARQLSADRVQHMVDEMSERVKRDPKDSSAWAMLAHSYDMLGRRDESIKAYARLAELLPKDAQVLADYAEALAATQERSFKGEPARLLQRALAADPRNLKALLLSGSEAFDRHAYREAIGFWERAKAASNDARVAQQIDSGLAEARLLAARPASAAVAKATVAARPASAAAAASGRTVSGRIVLAPALQSQASPDDTLFVFARPTLGSRMPVALLRKKVRDLPLEFRLDDSMAMVPDIHLSALSAVVVGARISKRGDATPHSGDMEGLSAPVTVGARDVKITISEVLK